MNIAIVGFGRIGKLITRKLINNKKIYVTCVLDKQNNKQNISYLLNYDSVYGSLAKKSKIDGENLIVGKQKIKILKSFDEVNFISITKKLDVIIDSSGDFTNVSKAKKLINKNPKLKYIFTNTNKFVEKEIIFGVNEHNLSKKDQMISTSICDSNAICHPLKWLMENPGIISGSVTTLHPWLSYQRLVDGMGISTKNTNVTWTDFSSGRSSINNLITKKTSAIKTVEKILPKLNGRITDISVRVPTNIVTCADMTLRLKKTNIKQVIDVLKKNALKSKVIKINYEHLTSLDYLKSNASATIDMRWTSLNQDLLKLVLWYDNEWGYSERVIDLLHYIQKKKLHR